MKIVVIGGLGFHRRDAETLRKTQRIQEFEKEKSIILSAFSALCSASLRLCGE
jgi:hypothetical protein